MLTQAFPSDLLSDVDRMPHTLSHTGLGYIHTMSYSCISIWWYPMAKMWSSTPHVVPWISRMPQCIPISHPSPWKWLILTSAQGWPLLYPMKYCGIILQHRPAILRLFHNPNQRCSVHARIICSDNALGVQPLLDFVGSIVIHLYKYYTLHHIRRSSGGGFITLPSSTLDPVTSWRLGL